MDIKKALKVFPNGTGVYHVRGGQGKIKHLENDWSTDPPTVMADVQVSNTCFYDVRRFPIDELKIDRR